MKLTDEALSYMQNRNYSFHKSESRIKHSWLGWARNKLVILVSQEFHFPFSCLICLKLKEDG